MALNVSEQSCMPQLVVLWHWPWCTSLCSCFSCNGWPYRDPCSCGTIMLVFSSLWQVPIFSLPQEWLWCESWCSDVSKAEAKTIDLCNNPQHKEPKLDMAKRVISGSLFEESWVELDAEVRAAEDARPAKNSRPNGNDGGGGGASGHQRW
ncbi:unnamed protein product [Ectocarpus sp. 4 AP-2014]